MATKSDLRTRLKRRLGLGVVSEVEKERLGEALNSGLARAVSDGIPGLAHDSFVGSVLGSMSMSSAVTAVGSSSVTIAGANVLTSKAMPHDILVIDVAGTETKFLIRDVIDATHVDIGIPASAVLSGGAASTIERRALILPSSGQIASIQPESANRGAGLAREPSIAKRDPFDTGTACFFEQRYSQIQATSFASLWPAPTDITEQFTVSQSQSKARLSADSDTLAFPEGALDAILELARLAYLTWAGTSNPQTAMLALESKRDTADSLKNSSTSKQIYTKT